MGRTTYWMNVSMDLFIEHAAGEEGGGSWMRIDEQLHEVFNARAREFALSIEGRVIYETMEQFWPAARFDESLPQVLREYGHIWTDMPKVLVSNTRTNADHDTRIVGGDDAIEQLARMCEQTDGSIGIGGANLATQLLRHGVLDELLLFTHPVVLGGGRPLFDSLDAPIECDLIDHHVHAGGVTEHRWSIRHG